MPNFKPDKSHQASIQLSLFLCVRDDPALFTAFAASLQDQSVPLCFLICIGVLGCDRRGVPPLELDPLWAPSASWLTARRAPDVPRPCQCRCMNGQ
eukprot:scaffold59179_cov27-Tisochrysis_lutea.AAC.1